MPIYPTRFREGEARGARLGRALRVIAGVRSLDEDLMDRIGRGFLERDELGASLVEAMRMREGEPSAVSRAQFQQALERGIDEMPDAAPTLKAYFGELTAVPGWVDRDQLVEGALLSRRLGQNIADILLQLSLIGGYRFGGPTDLLVATGALTGEGSVRRLAETQKWTATIGDPGSILPGGEAWRLTAHVRLMHAMVNAGYEKRWDNARWGLPINQTDLASTLALFDATVLLGCRALGVRITRREAEAYMHLWRYVGYLLGIDPDFWSTSERDRYRMAYHVLRAQGPLTEAGPALAQSAVDLQADRIYPGWPTVLMPLRARYERERMLSMMTVLLNPTSMRDLGLPRRPPWALAYIVPMNLVRYQVVARTPYGRRQLEAWGQRVRSRTLSSTFRGADQAVGDLPY
ncbi:hypothetical protein Back2_22650 [Nocardioides baekrokdamisoli]|uniref:ER-bound oxygenase mpaB/mpaB'/Rubber oxygenase catalytic domain-containing protein n=2 Tax=Nocardioides baekrokdamisoli TaxID=1804624 RepID=A0A3G9J2Z6_9ACTN|nr:hypothetical protein Back2_22650 [Nocardioides baekrokdamisoli]